MIRLYNYENNFGDDLSPYIISKLSGEKVVLRKPFSLSRFSLDFLRFFKKLLFKGLVDWSLLAYSPFNKVIISIGSILEESTSNSIVWGSGLGSKDIKIKGGEFLAVRGPLSQKRLSELGFKVPEVIGDPAILLPLIYPRKNAIIKKRFKVGIIPHKIDYVDIVSALQKLNLEDFLVIDLVDPNLEKVMDDFLSCDMILSSSLHGLIVSHSYNIPAVWFEKSPLAGDGSKFVDYFSSVGIKPYTAINYTEIDFSSDQTIKEIFVKAKNSTLANEKEIYNIQKNLIDVAPFKVKENYKL